MSSDKGTKRVARITRKQRNNRGGNPNTLKNLRPFAQGHSGNPGGTGKGTPNVSTALARLLALTPPNSTASSLQPPQRRSPASFPK